MPLNPLNPSRSTLTNGNLTASGTTDLPTITIRVHGTLKLGMGSQLTWTPPAASAAAGNYNFGQRPFANTTGTRLHTGNLPQPAVKDPSKFQVKLDTGANIKATCEGLFTYFMEWIKDRS